MSTATIEILLASAATSIEVAFTLPGGTGAVPDGGDQFAILQKQSAANGDIGWTNAPRVQSLQFDTMNQPASLMEGESRWNPTRRVVETYLGGGVTLQNGLETFIRAANYTGATIPDGTVVAFAGTDIANEVPKIVPMLADGSMPPLYVIGLATETIFDAGAIGRVTTFGEVHSVNTTGGPVGETWAEGDVLYASPTIPGGLTNVEPTPPAVAIVIAAVVKVDPLDGALLVRPALFPRLQYGTFADLTNQTHTTINTAKAVTFDTVELEGGVSRGVPTSRIITSAPGLYELEATLQVEKTSSNLGMIWTWLRKNGVDAPRTSQHSSISGNGVAESIARLWSVPLNAGDYVELMWAVSDLSIYLHSDPAPVFGPSAPSATIAVVKVNQ